MTHMNVKWFVLGILSVFVFGWVFRAIGKAG